MFNECYENMFISNDLILRSIIYYIKSLKTNYYLRLRRKISSFSVNFLFSQISVSIFLLDKCFELVLIKKSTQFKLIWFHLQILGYTNQLHHIVGSVRKRRNSVLALKRILLFSRWRYKPAFRAKTSELLSSQVFKLYTVRNWRFSMSAAPSVRRKARISK